MNRFYKIFLTVAFICASNFSVAGLIPTSTDFIQYDQNNDGKADYDIIWVSSWAYQFYGCDISISNQSDYLITEYNGSSSCQNQMFAPSYINDGWDFFENIAGIDIVEVVQLFNDKKFNDGNGGYITGFQFWNTNSVIIPAINPYNFSAISDWTKLSPIGLDPFQTGDIYNTNIFYTRVSQPVPEPSTLLIFALGLIALAARLKVAKK
jgi:hypothetical protein